MQVGAFIAAPVLGIVLVFRPEVYELSAAAFLALLAATRRSLAPALPAASHRLTARWPSPGG
ncbi:hypothetical protein QF035_010991 [Streptomyces umbrinus]|uniref:Uncharacterized protein n=1 Tax=Streptomyces umbrinus TaxID=67370 RepID=A0ABU0TC88_9ACTN|nr:hypothetical protein [Streptomyces umbrinus]MDQ1033409.1 hypothetical protein [Streptomyces umbrinus]